MIIEKFRVENYKSFLSSEEISLKSGISVIVGKNNSGKTALAELLSLRFTNLPHRSLKTVPTFGAPISDQTSRVRATLSFSDGELLTLLREMGTFAVPVRDAAEDGALQQSFLDAIVGTAHINCIFQPGGTPAASLEGYPDIGPQFSRRILFEVDPIRSVLVKKAIDTGQSGYRPVAETVAQLFNIRVFQFKAERMNIAESSISSDPNLLPDASNLPTVLNYLYSTNPNRFSRFIDLVREIFPQIQQITIPPIPNNQSRVRIMLWLIDPATERDDLAIPLSESGTGIGQIMSMLYVVLTASTPKTIVIDEPQSFLHPGAVRRLLSILRQFDQHQYIVTTHSPTVISSAQPEVLLNIQNVDGESHISIIDPQETKNMREVLLDVGARLSDVFGADSILWVEGATEELCFPVILSKIAKVALSGTVIVGVINTGDFLGKHSKLTWEIYTKLTKGGVLLPPAVGFLFDREHVQEPLIQDLGKRSDGNLRFLPRRMYENYLIHPMAIAEVVSKIEGFSSELVEPSVVEKWIKDNEWNPTFLEAKVDKSDQSLENWYRVADGASLLRALFAELSGTRVSYDKVKHGYQITEWIVEHDVEHLADLSELLRSFFPQQARKG